MSPPEFVADSSQGQVITSDQPGECYREKQQKKN
jgi:hypothetical protein